MDELTEFDILALLAPRSPNGPVKNAMFANAESVLAFAVELHNSYHPDIIVELPNYPANNKVFGRRLITPAQREILKLGAPVSYSFDINVIFDNMKTADIKIGVCVVDNFSFIIVNNKDRFIIVEPAENNVFSFSKKSPIPWDQHKRLSSYRYQLNPEINLFDATNIDLNFFNSILNFERFAIVMLSQLPSTPKEVRDRITSIPITADRREKTIELFHAFCDQRFLGAVQFDSNFRNLGASVCSTTHAWHVPNIDDLLMKSGDWIIIRNDDNFPELVICVDGDTKEQDRKYLVAIGGYTYMSEDPITDFHILAAKDTVLTVRELLVPFDQSSIKTGLKLDAALNRIGL